jgi:S-adenosylmethionine hydrolase
MIAVFTDFGLEGPYTGYRPAESRAGTRSADGGGDRSFGRCTARQRAVGAHPLAALAPWSPNGTMFVAVIDPGVGSDRAARA